MNCSRRECAGLQPLRIVSGLWHSRRQPSPSADSRHMSVFTTGGSSCGGGFQKRQCPPGALSCTWGLPLWRDHWIVITGVLFLIITEGFLIVGLVINLRKRRKAEQFLRESKQDVQSLAVRLIKTQEEELSRLSRELHDDLTQRLAGLAIDAGILEKKLMTVQDGASQELRSLKIKLIDVSEDVHNLSRQLHPSILDDMGLVEAVKSEIAIFAKRTGLALSSELQELPDSIPYDVALCLYRVIQEGLRNIEKHAETSEAHISLNALSDGLRLTIQDHGIGFDNNALRNQAGLGLSSMKERVRLINGTMSIKVAPGKGMGIEIFIPLREEHDQAAGTDR